MDLQSECLLLDTVEQKNKMIKKINEIIDHTIEEILKKFNLKQYVDVYKLNIKLSYLEKMKRILKKINNIMSLISIKEPGSKTIKLSNIV